MTLIFFVFSFRAEESHEHYSDIFVDLTMKPKKSMLKLRYKIFFKKFLRTHKIEKSGNSIIRAFEGIARVSAEHKIKIDKSSH